LLSLPDLLGEENVSSANGSASFGGTHLRIGYCTDILSASIPAEHALDVLSLAARAAKAGLKDNGPM
jgi:hypothetical protein